MSLRKKYSIRESYIPVSMIQPGETYIAYDDGSDSTENVLVENIQQDQAGQFIIDIMYENGEHDQWYLSPTDQVFRSIAEQLRIEADKQAKLLKEQEEAKASIKPTVKIFGVTKKSLNEADRSFAVKMTPLMSDAPKYQLGDEVIFEKKKGWIIGGVNGDYGKKWIVQCQYATHMATESQLTPIKAKTQVYGLNQFKFNDKTYALLNEQMVKCGIYFHHIPIKENNCYVKYSDWKDGKDTDNIKVLVEGETQLLQRGTIRILEDINSFANPENYIEGVIVDDTTGEAIENVMINVEDYTVGVGEADPVRVLRNMGDEPTLDTLPKGILNTLTI